MWEKSSLIWFSTKKKEGGITGKRNRFFLPFFKKGSAADFCDPGTLFSQSVNIHLKIIKCYKYMLLKCCYNIIKMISKWNQNERRNYEGKVSRSVRTETIKKKIKLKNFVK